jgi:2-hydroxychromene-2-carboxylate isomerase
VSVAFYFDFISPYSFLASQLIARRPELGTLNFAMRPVVFGTVLSKLGVKGPGEIPARRRAGLADVLLLASHYGISLEGPPTHPFNSIYALRSVCAVREEAVRLRLSLAYFEAAWIHGRSLDDVAVLTSILRELGIEQDPEEAATSGENRRLLKDYTAELLALGGWGVPTFMHGGHLFFGHDRLELLRAHVEGRAVLDDAKLDAMLARPQPGRIT